MHTVHCVNQDVGENQDPREKGDIPDPPEWVEQALPRHELGKEKEEETFSHVPAKPVPFEKPGDAQEIIISGDDSKQHKGAEEIDENFLQ